MKSQEQRIYELELQVKRLTRIVESLDLDKEFISLPRAAKMLQITERVIRYRLQNDDTLEFGKHYKLNGSHYRINVEEWHKLIESDARAKQM